MSMNRYIAAVILLVGGLMFPACGSDDTVDTAERLGEAVLAVAEGGNCGGLYGTCDTGLSCCRNTTPNKCWNLHNNPDHCGTCSNSCGGAQYACDNGTCVIGCDTHADCAADKICVWTGFNTHFPGYDYVAPNPDGGSCETVTCSVDTDCNPYEAPGDSLNGPLNGTIPDQTENNIRCCSGHCVATASDPKHCGSCTVDLTTIGNKDTCYSACTGTTICGTWGTYYCDDGVDCPAFNGQYHRHE